MSSSVAAAEGGAAVRSSVCDSRRGCGITGTRIEEEDQKRKILIPEYLRLAMAEAIPKRRNGAGTKAQMEAVPDSIPLVVFVNTNSGGGHGKKLMRWLQDFIGKEQVFDISDRKSLDFIQYGLTCLDGLVDHDDCAKAVRQNLRIMVAGGDGTVGWILRSLGELFMKQKKPVPPIGIIPLGTGNDLSRSFGWGGSFPFAWRSAVKKSLHRAVSNPVRYLDGWHVTMMTQETEKSELPESLKSSGKHNLTEDVDIESELRIGDSHFEGIFYNYFSIGMDAQVAHGFHHLRRNKPNIARGRISNKLIYAGYSCTQGWFFTPCVKTPGLRGLSDILGLYIKKLYSKEWVKIEVPPSIRAITFLNLDSYGGGRHPWGHPTPEYLEERKFLEPRVDDGLLEIFGLKQGWHASFVMAELISAKHIAQAAEIKLELQGGDNKSSQTYMQMDGEPWKQPVSNPKKTIVKIENVGFQSRIISGK